MRTSALIGTLVAALAISLAAEAGEHVRVIYGQKGNALIVSGGDKSHIRPDGARYAFLRDMSPVDCEALNRWLAQAYVERGAYAGFADCPVNCAGVDQILGDALRWRNVYANELAASLTSNLWAVQSLWISWPHALLGADLAGRPIGPYTPEGWPSLGDSLPGVESTYRGVRVALAAGGSFDRFTYDSFAAYARAALADPSTPLPELVAACRLLDLVTGQTEDDRLPLCRRVDAIAETIGAEGYWLAPLLDAADLIPSATLRAVLRDRASALAQALATPSMADVLELARLRHILDEDAAVSSDAIARAVFSLASSSGGFYADAGSLIPDISSTLCALEALAFIGRVVDVDATAVQDYILSCWVSPGFAPVRPADVAPIGIVTCTDLLTTYAGTEALAILENRDAP